jgi:molybdopterin-containing oxidoreductase family membrane subunit
MVSLSYRYLPIFPQEAELNPIESQPASGEVREPETDAPQEDAAEAAAGDPEPAQA